MADVDEITSLVKKTSSSFLKAKEEMAKVIIGQEEMMQSFLLALLTDGHLLLEGVPGLAKTLACKTLASILDVPFSRIQFTPDLLPADLIGTTIYQPSKETFSIKKGPIFTSILLADEINRAPAKVQSALLEVMQEKQVTIGKETFPMEEPYLVLATQNPIEQSGTYPLPEAQVDRFFMKIKINYPSFSEEKVIVENLIGLSSFEKVKKILSKEEVLEAKKIVNKIFVDDKVVDYIVKIVFATRYPEKYGIDIARYIYLGASPRASLNLTLASKANAFFEGRGYITPQDVKEVAKRVLRHRILLSYEAEAEELTSDDLIEKILSGIFVP